MSFIRSEGRDLIHWCPHCGYLAYVEKVTPDGMIICTKAKTPEEVLPKPGTKLMRCLGLLAAYRELTTAEVAEKMKQTTSLTSSQLTVLQAKGLIEKKNQLKGVTGGSTWGVLSQVRQMLIKE